MPAAELRRGDMRQIMLFEAYFHLLLAYFPAASHGHYYAIKEHLIGPRWLRHIEEAAISIFDIGLFQSVNYSRLHGFFWSCLALSFPCCHMRHFRYIWLFMRLSFYTPLPLSTTLHLLPPTLHLFSKFLYYFHTISRIILIAILGPLDLPRIDYMRIQPSPFAPACYVTSFLPLSKAITASPFHHY